MHFPELRTEQAEGEESDFSSPEEARKSKPLFLQQKAVSVTLLEARFSSTQFLIRIRRRGCQVSSCYRGVHRKPLDSLKTPGCLLCQPSSECGPSCTALQSQQGHCQEPSSPGSNSCCTGKLLHISVPQFPPLWKGVASSSEGLVQLVPEAL